MTIIEFLSQLLQMLFKHAVSPPRVSFSGNAPQITSRALITIPEHINARFDDTGSAAWANQPGGKHLGTDFGAPEGSSVYAPYHMIVTNVGSYKDSGRYGDYVIGQLDDGVEYYSGHLKNVTVMPGNEVQPGQTIGYTNRYNHTHIQLRINGELADFEQYKGPK